MCDNLLLLAQLGPGHILNFYTRIFSTLSWLCYICIDKLIPLCCMEKTAPVHDHLTAILTGDRTMLRQMYQALYPMVRSIIKGKGGTEDDTKDAFQDAVMVIFSKAKQPGFQLTSQFSTFFCGVAFNQWRSQHKKKVNSEVMIPEGMEYTAEGQPELDHGRLERQKLFDKAFARLGEDCRELLLLFFQKMQMIEIAEIRGYGSDNYARKRKHECQERLIGFIKSYPEYRELLNH